MEGSLVNRTSGPFGAAASALSGRLQMSMFCVRLANRTRPSGPADGVRSSLSPDVKRRGVPTTRHGSGLRLRVQRRVFSPVVAAKMIASPEESQRAGLGGPSRCCSLKSLPAPVATGSPPSAELTHQSQLSVEVSRLPAKITYLASGDHTGSL